MDSFVIANAAGRGSVEFFGRVPADRSRPIERFDVRVSIGDMEAVGPIYLAAGPDHPGPLFAAMAEQWRGWPGELSWESLEGEFRLGCTVDRSGHVAIAVELRSGSPARSWSVQATIGAEAGQLDDLARRAAEFFGAGQ